MLDKNVRKTIFTSKVGTFKFEVIPFGLMKAPATFQRMMDEVLKGLSFPRVYINDMVIFSKKTLMLPFKVYGGGKS